MAKSSYRTVFKEKYSVQDVLEMPGVQEIVEERSDKHMQALGGLHKEYELEITYEDHLVVVNFVVGEY